MPTRVLLMLAMGLLPVAVAAQGLGGVAREAAHRRSQAQPAGGEAPCYTDADLRAEPDVDDDAAVDAGGPEAGAPQGEAVETESAGSRTPRGDDPDKYDLLREELDRAAARRKESERKWRERVAAVRAKLAAARKEHDVACNPNSIALRGG